MNLGSFAKLLRRYPVLTLLKYRALLHAVAADETDTKLVQLYAYENYRKPGIISSAEIRLSIQLMNSWNNHPEVTGAAVEPGFADYLQNKFLSSVSDEEKHGVFLKRNKEKLTGLDESSGTIVAMED